MSAIQCSSVRSKYYYHDNERNNTHDLSLFQLLPTNPLYCPPINFRVFDKRTFGRLPIVGLHVIKTLNQYKVNQETTAQQRDETTG